MYVPSHRRMQPHALAGALALAVCFVAAPAFAGRAELSGLQDGVQYNQFIVKYRDDSAEGEDAGKAKTAVVRMSQFLVGSKSLKLDYYRRTALGADVVRTASLDRSGAEQLMRQIAADPAVEYVEADAMMRAQLTPNDTRYANQWGFFEPVSGINAPAAWNLATGSGVVVAVLDTGITPHSDLGANILPGYDFLTNAQEARDGNGRDANPNDEGDWWDVGDCGGSKAYDSSWHGTHTTGTIAALTNNGKGVAGTAFNAKVVPVRVLGTCGGPISDIADAIVWASGGNVPGIPANPNPAEVINMSLGGGGECGSTYQSAIDSANSRMTTVVVSAGNNNSQASYQRPANCRGVVVVASMTREGKRSDFSNYGDAVDIAAPGSEVLSTLNSGKKTQSTESYANYWGTSMAAPHVAGVVALMQSAAKTPLTPAEIERKLKANTRPFEQMPDQYVGPGLLDARRAVNSVITNNDQPVVSFRAVSTGSAVNFTDTSVDADGRVVSRAWTFGDGSTGTGANPSHAYAVADTYLVKLAVVDDDGADNAAMRYITASTAGPGGTQVYPNSRDVAITSLFDVSSSVSVEGRSGNAPATAKVTVRIVNPVRGWTKVALQAPDGSTYELKGYNPLDNGADVNATFTVNVSSEALNGSWKLLANNLVGSPGRIDYWSIAF